MKHLLTASAALEAGAGLALLSVPSQVVALLLGSPLDAPAALILARLTGAALLSLALACWLARTEPHSRSARALAAALLLYNLAAVTLFLYAALGPHLVGLALWPAIFLHAAMAVWCIAALKPCLKGPPS